MEKTVRQSNKLKNVLSLLKAYRAAIIVGIVFAVVGALFGVATPQLIAEISNVIQDGIKVGTLNWDELYHSLRIALVFICLGFLFSYIQAFILADVGGKLGHDLRYTLNKKIDRIPISYFDRTPSGEIQNRMTTNVETFSDTLVDNVSTILSNVATLVGCIAAMFAINWILALCSIFTALLGLVIAVLVMKKAGPYFKGNQDDLGAINGQIDEVFTGHLVVKAFNCEKDVCDQFDKKNDEAYGKDWRSKFYADVLTPLMTFIGNLGYVVVCVVGAILSISHIANTDLPQIIAFIMLVRLFETPLTTLAQANATIQPAMAAGDRIFELKNEKEMPAESDNVKFDKVRGEVEFDKVMFGYDPNRIILKGFSGKIKAGSKVAIVGPTGAGKTTLVNLLMRFYELNSGNIKIDGIPVDSVSKQELHNYLGMVLQETWTFEGTIRENIVYSTPNVTDEQLMKAIDDVGLTHFVSTLPNGVDTVINESSSISAGQKQLITIARAMLENAPILILDEATSSVDTRTEKIIQNAIDSLTNGRTSFVIAHRLSTIKNADLILVMKDGDIVETGNHDELLKLGGLYAELYNSQFDKTAAE